MSPEVAKATAVLRKRQFAQGLTPINEADGVGRLVDDSLAIRADLHDLTVGPA